MDEQSFSPLDALADLPALALPLLLALGGATLMCVLILLGAVMADPSAALPAAEQERVDRAPVAAVIPVSVADPGAALGLGLLAVQVARAQIGKPYVWGASGPDRFDCSGLMQWVWAQLGVRIPKFSVDQYRGLQPVATRDLRPGDLVFFDICCDQPGVVPNHVGMYAGNGRMVHAPQPGEMVREVSLETPFWQHAWYGAARPRLPAG
jgi:NlpC/P60 family